MAYRILGADDAVDTCEKCGKRDLKCTVVLENVETLAVVRYGRDCAAKAIAGRASVTRSAVDQVERQARKASIAAIEAGLVGAEKVEIRTARGHWGWAWKLTDGRTFVRFTMVITGPSTAAKLVPGAWTMLAESVFVGVAE